MNEAATAHMTDEMRRESDLARGRNMLERATWAARSFATYGPDEVRRIVRNAAESAAAQAEEFARRAVQETGFGVVEHKAHKNRVCSSGLLDAYAGHDYVSPRIDHERKIVEVPKPAGVVLALTPSTNPVATVLFKAILALMTRNAVVICPHPRAREVCARAAEVLARAAVEAGAPDGVVQCLDRPSLPVVEDMMSDHRTSVVLATGGSAMVRAAYRSGNPALGVGPANVPVMVDSTADVRAAAKRIIDSKAFDNSVLCTNESVLILEDAVADRMLGEMTRSGAQLLKPAEVERLAEVMFPNGSLNADVVGKDASEIARMAGLSSGARTKVLLAPIEAVLPEIPMAREKLSPVLGVLRVPSADAGIKAAKACIRIAGAGHSAAIHSEDTDMILRYAEALPVLRVAVNVGNSTGSAGLDTNLAPSMTIGTGMNGKSNLDENLQPKHLVSWSRIAHNADERERMGSFEGLEPWQRHDHRVPAYPYASNDPRSGSQVAPPVLRAVGGAGEAVENRILEQVGGGDSLREEIRRLVAQEISHLMRS